MQTDPRHPDPVEAIKNAYAMAGSLTDADMDRAMNEAFALEVVGRDGEMGLTGSQVRHFAAFRDALRTRRCT